MAVTQFHLQRMQSGTPGSESPLLQCEWELTLVTLQPHGNIQIDQLPSILCDSTQLLCDHKAVQENQRFFVNNHQNMKYHPQKTLYQSNMGAYNKTIPLGMSSQRDSCMPTFGSAGYRFEEHKIAEIITVTKSSRHLALNALATYTGVVPSAIKHLRAKLCGHKFSHIVVSNFFDVTVLVAEYEFLCSFYICQFDYYL